MKVQNIPSVLVLLLTSILLGTEFAAAMDLAVTTSAPSPALVGTIITFAATASEAPSGNQWFRFRVRRQGEDYQLIRDYSPASTLEWTESSKEGSYEMEVSARNLDTGEISTSETSFDFAPIVTGSAAVVTPTSNSLVFLYSAPPCEEGQRMRVAFKGPNGIAQRTPYQDCDGLSMNFYLAGIRALTEITAQHTLDTGSSFESSPELTFTSGALPDNLYSEKILFPPPAQSTYPLLIGSPLGTPPLANDLEGNILWYGPSDLALLTRTEAGGFLWGLVEAYNGVPSQQLLRQFDLTGMTILETNAARVNEQLKAMGKRQITAFHHEVRPLTNGRIATLGYVEQILTDVQAPGPVDVLGDMIIVLDRDLNVVWAWDTFDNLDVTRLAVLHETCPQVCPAPSLAPTAMDWTHGNALQQTPDGNLLYSSRHQDWLIKIAYDFAEGDGHIIWRLGRGGDFTIHSSDAYPWFSHQHDGNFDLSNPTRLIVFDNGNTRITEMGTGNSRGQVFQIDEKNRVVTPVLNADLGVYSLAVGSAQTLRGGNFHFDAGFVMNQGALESYSMELDKTGNIRYTAHANTILYRTFRQADMYTPN